jgi:hypothetical protein
MNSRRVVFLLLGCVLVVGCTRASIRPLAANGYLANLQLSNSMSASMSEGCKDSLNLLPDAEKVLDRSGVSAKSSGMFLVTAGDEFLMVDVEFVGKTSTGYAAVSTAEDRVVPIAETDYLKAIELARIDIAAAKPDTEKSVRDHDSCEFIVMPSTEGRVVFATQQSMSGSRGGVHSYGGFSNLRKYFRSLFGHPPDES